MTTTKVYEFDELSDLAKEAAIQAYSDCNVFDEWWDSDYEDAKTIGLKITSFDLNPIGCEGEWIGDAEETAALIQEHHGEGCETYKDATTFLSDLEVSQAAHKAQPDYDPDYDEYDETDEYEELCSEFLKTICGDYGTMLSNQYDYLTGEEAIKDTIEANEWEFTEDGEKYL